MGPAGLGRIAACVLLLGLAAPPAGPERAASEAWTTLRGCRLAENTANDGDSFHVEHAGRTYLFRIYFADCPETSRQVPDRVRAQAAYWKTDEASVLECGRQAAAFTRRALRRPFTVRTKWQDARGSSRGKRYFAFVETESGRDLAEELAAEGLARAYGASSAHPEGPSARKVWKRLDRLEEEARKAGRGGWGRQAGPAP
jgi:endonuclease YncB( thermonuclease family)